ncbi:alkaline phosphatase family protein [Sphaerotilus sp.]|uniref:alkaline phosphatase family protein n=1 Tax=Sphaerotilus sp. TaxID=2093942 RepID=UPI00286E0B58|nr:alkaline phosphatase family protein [Sphaerotilus sp.]
MTAAKYLSWWTVLVAALSGVAAPASAAPYDHIVVVVLENRSADAGGEQRIWGNPAMPFLNGLANDPQHGARFTNAYAAETPYRRIPAGFKTPLSARPSQPNYLYLFAASHQGVLPAWFQDPTSPYRGDVRMANHGDALPAKLDDQPAGIGNRLVPAARRPFSTANLGAALRQSGKTFLSFSESLPHPLWDGEGDVNPLADHYRRKHNPAINWIDFGLAYTPRKVSEAQRRFLLPVDVNLGFHATEDPTGRRWRGFAEDEHGRALDYTKLPTVSFVVPNEQHDAHSAPLADADDWLRRHIGPYAAWARTHNSLLIVTFDEDGSTDTAQGDGYRTGRHTIATLFHGAGVRPGVYRERIDALNVLATVLHDQGLLEGFRRDFLATCVEDRPTCEREHANLRPIADVFGRGEPLIELPAVR